MKQKDNYGYKKNVKSIVEYIITNRLFISYVVLSLIATICVRAFTIGSALKLKPLLTDLGFILVIGGLGYLVKPKNQFKYYFTWLIIFNLICLISSIYYRFFTSFASIGELATVRQTETVTGSIFDRLRIADGIYILIPIIFYLIHKKLLSSSYYTFIDKIEKSKKMVVSTVLLGVIFLGYTFGVAKNSDYSRLTKQWNRIYIVERFGIIMYQFNDFAQFLRPQLSSLFGQEKALESFNEYFDSKKATAKNEYTGILKGKNIVFVHMESMQSFLMDLSFNGREVTPNLNKLAKEGMHFTNFYPQVSTGTSSDTEFTLLTGLMPASSGTVFVSYYDRNYFTIPKYLKEENYFTDDSTFSSKITEVKNNVKNTALSEAESAFSTEGYQKSITIIETAISFCGENEELTNALNKYKAYVPVNIVDIDPSETSRNNKVEKGETGVDNTNQTHKKNLYAFHRLYSQDDAYAVYPLMGKYDTLTFEAYRSNYDTSTDESITIKIFGDNTELQSIVIDKGFNPNQYSIDISGVQKLKIVFESYDTNVFKQFDKLPGELANVIVSKTK